MSGRNQKKANKQGTRPWYAAAWLTGLLLAAVAAYCGLALTGDPGAWWGVVRGQGFGDLLALENPGGPVGSVLNVTLHLVFGSLWCWSIPALLATAGIGFLFARQGNLRPWVLRAVPFWLVTSAWISQPGGPLTEEAGIRYGGIVGVFLARGFHALFGLWGGRIFLTLFLVVAVILILKPWLGPMAGVWSGLGKLLAALGRGLLDIMSWPLTALATGARWLARQASRPFGGRLSDEGMSPETEEFDEADWGEVESGAEPRERTLHQVPQPVAEPRDEPQVDVPDERVLPGAAGEFTGDGQKSYQAGQKFLYPRDAEKICPWLIGSMNGMIQILQDGGTLPWEYRGTPYEKEIDSDGVTTEFIRCVDPTDSGIVVKLIRTKI